MTKRNLFKEAHKLAKEIKNEYPEVDYKFQFSLCLAYLREEKSLKDQLREAVEVAVKEFEASDYKWNVWEKAGHKRIYISLVWYRNINSHSQYAKKGTTKEIKCGYLDIVNNVYVAEDKYVKQYDLLNKMYV